MVMKGCGKFWGKTPWDDQAVEILKQMWESGNTASHIALTLVELGYSITRNAVIGKAHRMNIKQPPRDLSPKDKENQPRKRIVVPATHPHASTWKPKPKRETKLPTHIPTRTLDPDNPGIPITELSSTNCHAIIRDGNRFKLATYCGCAAEAGKSFCRAHAAIYYRAVETKFRPGRVRIR